MSGSATNVNIRGKGGKFIGASDAGHIDAAASFPFPKVFPLMRCISKTEAFTLPNCPCAGFTIQNLSETEQIRWGRNTSDEAPFIDRNFVGDSKGGVIYPRNVYPLPFLDTNTVSVVGEEDTEFQLIAYVNTTTDPIIDTTQPNQITPPEIVSTTPADAATGIAVNTIIVIVMDSSMDPTTINDDNITLSPDFDCTCEPDPEDDTKIIIIPSADLDFSTLHTVTLTNAIRDIEGHRMVADSFEFTTAGAPDTTAPTVSSRSPVNAATGVDRNVSPTITFSEAMSAASITNTTCRVITTSGSVNQAATVTLSADKTTVTINPTATLAASTSFTLRATTGVEDLALNNMAAQSDSTFTTAAADTTPPTITGRSPGISVTGIATSTNIVVTFSEAMLTSSITSTTFKLTKAATGAAIAGTITFSSGNTVATLNPTSSLENSTTYTMTVLGGASGVKDATSNAMTTTSAWSFITIAAAYTVVYNVSGDAWNELNGDDILDGLKLTSSSGSGIYNDIIKKITVTLRREGTLGGGDNIDCKICSVDDWNDTKQSFGNMPANSVTTSASGAQYTFENAEATYHMTVNDCIIISQREGDDDDHIQIRILESNVWSYGLRVHSGDEEGGWNEETGEEFAGVLYT